MIRSFFLCHVKVWIGGQSLGGSSVLGTIREPGPFCILALSFPGGCRHLQDQGWVTAPHPVRFSSWGGG